MLMVLGIWKYIIIVMYNTKMMKAFITLLLTIFSSTLCFSQETIDLKVVPFEILNQNFYIDQVFDVRQDIHLGVIKNSSDEKVKLYFQDSTSTTIMKFISNALPKTTNKIPIDLKITNLVVEEAQTSIEHMTARVYIELYFYAKSGEELYKIAHYEKKLFPLSDLTEIRETHEQRIRASLENCLRSFIANKNAENPANTNLIKDNISSDESILKAFVPLGKWFNLLTFRRVIDRTNEGWQIAYTGFSDSNIDLIIPFEIAFSQFRAKPDVLENRGYSSIDSYVLGFGFNGYIKMIPGFYIDLGINAPIGMEVLRDLTNKRSNNLLIGLGASQGVKIIPWEDFGIVIGAGLFQRLQTSKIVTRNFGFELEIGFNF